MFKKISGTLPRAIILFNLISACSLLIATIALSVVFFNAASAAWRALYPQSRVAIKNSLGLGKPNEDEIAVVHQKTPFEMNASLTCYGRLFTTTDYRSVIKRLGASESRKYLLRIIDSKMSNLTVCADSEKHSQKKNVLLLLQDALMHNVTVVKKQIEAQYPRLKDNFWCEKSDTEQLLLAVEYYHKHLVAVDNESIMELSCSAKNLI